MLQFHLYLAVGASNHSACFALMPKQMQLKFLTGSKHFVQQSWNTFSDQAIFCSTLHWSFSLVPSVLHLAHSIYIPFSQVCTSRTTTKNYSQLSQSQCKGFFHIVPSLFCIRYFYTLQRANLHPDHCTALRSPQAHNTCNVEDSLLF